MCSTVSQLLCAVSFMMKFSLFRFSSNAKKKAYPKRIHAKLCHYKEEASVGVFMRRLATRKAAPRTHTCWSQEARTSVSATQKVSRKDARGLTQDQGRKQEAKCEVRFLIDLRNFVPLEGQNPRNENLNVLNTKSYFLWLCTYQELLSLAQLVLSPKTQRQHGSHPSSHHAESLPPLSVKSPVHQQNHSRKTANTVLCAPAEILLAGSLQVRVPKPQPEVCSEGRAFQAHQVLRLRRLRLVLLRVR